MHVKHSWRMEGNDEEKLQCNFFPFADGQNLLVKLEAISAQSLDSCYNAKELRFCDTFSKFTGKEIMKHSCK